MGAVWEAVEQATQLGISAGAVAVKLLGPLPQKSLLDFVAKARAVVVPEENYSGQFAYLLQAPLCRKVHSVARYDGVPFTPGDILAQIQEANDAR